MHQPSEESIKEFEKHLKTVVISILEGVIQPPQEMSIKLWGLQATIIESEYDVPFVIFVMTSSNPLFDIYDDSTSSDDESLSDENVPKEIYSNPLFDVEIISTKIDLHHFNAESDLIESLLNRHFVLFLLLRSILFSREFLR
ncbi:hypothetical protein Tco_0566766 [Tanacetum coccineum]